MWCRPESSKVFERLLESKLLLIEWGYSSEQVSSDFARACAYDVYPSLICCISIFLHSAKCNLVGNVSLNLVSNVNPLLHMIIHINRHHRAESRLSSNTWGSEYAVSCATVIIWGSSESQLDPVICSVSEWSVRLPTRAYHTIAFPLSISLWQNQEVSEPRMDASIWDGPGWRRGEALFGSPLASFGAVGGAWTWSKYYQE